MELKPGYKQTEVGVIPEDWDAVPLGKLYKFSNGVNADKAAYGKGLRFINVLEPITYSHIRGPEITGLVELTSQVASAYTVNHGDIVFNRTSETDTELGMAAAYLGHEKVVFGGFVIRGQAISDDLDPTYAGYALRGEMVRDQIIPLGQGAVRANIGQESLRKVRVLVPPEHEQKLIAEALQDIDSLLTSIQESLYKKRQIKQAAMQELLTGKRRLPGFEGEWEVKRLGDIATIDPENLGSNTHPHYRFNYISLEDVDQGSLLSWSEQEFSTSPSRARRRLRRNDVLVSTVRPNLMSHLLFSQDGGEWVCSTGFALLRCNGELADPSYVFFHLFSAFINKQIEGLLTGSNYPAISSRDVRRLEIPAPALSEQKEIARILTSMEDEIISLTQRLEKARLLKQGMMQQLLTGKIRLI